MRPKLTAVAVLVVGALLAAGCGGGGSGSSSSAAHTKEAVSKDAGLGQASTEFLAPKAENNKYVRFGSEAPDAEREAASLVLQENLTAREKAEFTAQCATLSRAAIHEVTGSAKAAVAQQKCPSALKNIAEPLKATAEIRADNLGGPIAVLRIKGDEAYALFHGTDNADYSMPMSKEEGEWKVAAIVTNELGLSGSAAG